MRFVAWGLLSWSLWRVSALILASRTSALRMLPRATAMWLLSSFLTPLATLGAITPRKVFSPCFNIQKMASSVWGLAMTFRR